MLVRNLEALFTINTNTVQFQRAASHLDNLAQKAQTVMRAIAGYWAVQTLQNQVINIAKSFDEIGKTGGYLGVATDALQELRYAAHKSGVSMDALDDALKEIQVRAYDAKSGTGEAAEAFLAMGFKSTDAARRIREPLELLDEIADAMTTMQPQKRIWIADAIFGDEGSMVLKMLTDGSLGLKKMREEARALGIVLSTDSIANATRFTQALTRLHHTSAGIGNAFTEKLLPALSWITEKCGNLVAALNQTESRASLVRVTLMTLGGILTALSIKLTILAIKSSIAFGPMILMAGAVIGGIAALALLIDDLWVAFKGGDSIVGATFSGIMQWSSKAGKAMKDGFSEAWQSINKEFARFSQWINEGLALLVRTVKELLAGLVPDFLKDGFVATMKMVGGISEQESSRHLNHRLAPTLSSISHQNRLTSNQNVNVAVNVKSGSEPREIGGEVAKAVKQELERERLNAFMGVAQYAG